MTFNEEGFIQAAIEAIASIDKFSGDIDLTGLQKEYFKNNGEELGLDDILLEVGPYLYKINNKEEQRFKHSIVQNEDFFWVYLINEQPYFITRSRNDLIGIIECLVSMNKVIKKEG